MPTSPENDIVRDPLIDEPAPTVETAVIPPEPLPPPVAPPPPVPGGYPVDERVVVEDAAGTRVVTRDVRPPLPPDEDPRRWNWLTPALVFILLAALGIVLAAVLLNRNDDNKKNNAAKQPASTVTVRESPPAQPASVSIAVPNVVGQTRDAAQGALTGAGLDVVVVTVPGPAPAGQVLAQSPAAGGTLKSGDPVRINVSDGQATASGATATPTTPSSDGGNAPAASPPSSTPDTSSSSSPSQTDTASSSSPSEPASTPAPPEPTPVSVPTLSGDVKAGVQSLVGKGLAATINYVPSDEPLGTIVSQSPSGGTSSKTGTHITLSVSSGPGDKEQATVPDTTGQTIEQAVATLNAAGLRLILVKKTVDDKGQAGKVVEQTPEPGAQAPKRAQVLTYMGAFKG